jgi:Flp pilus assembly protein TadD
MLLRARFLAAVLTAAVAASWAVPATAQSAKRSEQAAKPPVSRIDRSRNLDFLFGALKLAPDETTAKAIEERIWSVWTASRSDTANLLMTRVKTAIEAKDLDLAVTLLDGILKREPRHFGALAGLGLILQDIGDDKQALTVYRRALEVYPRMERIPDLVKTLQEKIEGRDI